MPLYLEFFDQNASVEINIIENVLNPFVPLFKEPDFLIREELRDVTNYYAILHVIASGKKHHKDISKQTGIDNRGLQYYLKQECQMDLKNQKDLKNCGGRFHLFAD